MLTYPSTALMGILLSLSAISCLKLASHVAPLQPLDQTVEVASAQVTHKISHRGSGRGPECEIWS
jgi:hypothetical protein